MNGGATLRVGVIKDDCRDANYYPWPRICREMAALIFLNGLGNQWSANVIKRFTQDLWTAYG